MYKVSGAAVGAKRLYIYKRFTKPLLLLRGVKEYIHMCIKIT
jgi:hypothetical protein